jgi:uncharacterized protein Yka (UPF0111/DUF47 family)
MSGNSNSVVSRLVDRVFPIMPNFYGLIDEQCDLAVESMEQFVQFMESGDGAKADEVRRLEKEGDELKARNIDTLNAAFATPMDREDIYRAITSIDHIINYAKTTVREMDVLGITPDAYTLEFAMVLRDGANSLRNGYKKLSSTPASADDDAQAVRKAERNAEKIYRRALANLFDNHCFTGLDVNDESPMSVRQACAAMDDVIQMFKRREVYRHLSNAADRLARAGENLHDIVIKIS